MSVVSQTSPVVGSSEMHNPSILASSGCRSGIRKTPATSTPRNKKDAYTIRVDVEFLQLCKGDPELDIILTEQVGMPEMKM